MKRILIIMLIATFLFVGCATNKTMQGAGIGAGAGTIISVIAGKSGGDAALWILGGALAGGLIGNLADQADQQAKQLSTENRGKVYVAQTEEPTSKTNCRKVTKRNWKNGSLISETTEEVCTGNRQSNTYE